MNSENFADLTLLPCLEEPVEYRCKLLDVLSKLNPEAQYSLLNYAEYLASTPDNLKIIALPVRQQN